MYILMRIPNYVLGNVMGPSMVVTCLYPEGSGRRTVKFKASGLGI